MNEPPKEIKVGVPIFWKAGMEWVTLTEMVEIGGDCYWYFVDSSGGRQRRSIREFTYSPGIPDKPVEWVEDEVEVRESGYFQRGEGGRCYTFTCLEVGVPVRDIRRPRLVFDLPKGHAFLDRPKREGE